MNRLSHLQILWFSLVSLADAFSSIQYNPTERTTFLSGGEKLCRYAKSQDSENDENEDATLGDKDWRAFRAKLVMDEKKTNNNEDSATTTSSSDDSDSSDSDFSDEEEVRPAVKKACSSSC